MFVIQCIIISLLCAVSGNAFPLLGNLKRPLSGNSLGWYTLGRPLIGGTICGIILGDIKAGVELGIGVQLVYLAVVTPGGAVGLDVSFMAYPVIAIGILGKLDAGATIAIASGIGVLGSFTFTAQAAVGSMIKGIYTKALADHDYKSFVKKFWLYNQTIYFALRFIPSFIAIYFGAQYIGDFMEMLPQFVSNGMNALGGILPAVGIAALLTTTIHNKLFIIFFLVGFTLVVFMNINIIGLTFIAAGIAYLYYIGSDKGTTYTNNTLTVEEEEVL